MVVNNQEIIDAIAILTDNRNIRVAVKQSFLGALICGFASFVVSLLLGPIGFLLGGVVGASIAYYVKRGTFRPLSDLIRNDLTERQKQKLVDTIKNVAMDLDISDWSKLVLLLMTAGNFQDAALKATMAFILNEFKVNVRQ